MFDAIEQFVGHFIPSDSLFEHNKKTNIIEHAAKYKTIGKKHKHQVLNGSLTNSNDCNQTYKQCHLPVVAVSKCLPSSTETLCVRNQHHCSICVCTRIVNVLALKPIKVRASVLFFTQHEWWFFPWDFRRQFSLAFAYCSLVCYFSFCQVNQIFAKLFHEIPLHTMKVYYIYHSIFVRSITYCAFHSTIEFHKLKLTE